MPNKFGDLVIMKFYKPIIFILGFSFIVFICTCTGTNSNKKHRKASTKNLSPMDRYRIDIAFIIEKNWKFSAHNTNAKDKISTEIAFKVMPDGTIKDIVFIKTSGNKTLDDSAFKAVASSSPLIPHPKSIDEQYVVFRMRFTPKSTD